MSGKALEGCCELVQEKITDLLHPSGHQGRIFGKRDEIGQHKKCISQEKGIKRLWAFLCHLTKGYLDLVLGFLMHLLVHTICWKTIYYLYPPRVQNISPWPAGQTGPDTRRLGFATHHFFAAAQLGPGLCRLGWGRLSHPTPQRYRR